MTVISYLQKGGCADCIKDLEMRSFRWALNPCQMSLARGGHTGGERVAIMAPLDPHLLRRRCFLKQGCPPHALRSWSFEFGVLFMFLKSVGKNEKKSS